MTLKDSVTFPNISYVMSKIWEILEYSNENTEIKLKDHLGADISVKELAERYYSNPFDYFDLRIETDAQQQGSSASQYYYLYLISKKVSSDPIRFDYFQNDKIASESRERPENIQNLGDSDPEDYNKF